MRGSHLLGEQRHTEFLDHPAVGFQLIVSPAARCVVPRPLQKSPPVRFQCGDFIGIPRAAQFEFFDAFLQGEKIARVVLKGLCRCCGDKSSIHQRLQVVSNVFEALIFRCDGSLF